MYAECMVKAEAFVGSMYTQNNFMHEMATWNNVHS